MNPDEYRARFVEMVDRNADLLLRYINGIVGDWNIAEDILQEVFQKVFRDGRWPEMSPPQSIKWLKRIGFNEAMNHFRKNRRDPLKGSDELKEWHWRDDGDAGSDSLIEKERRVCVGQCLAKLPDKKARLLELRFVEECSHAEIAARLKIPIGSIGGRLKRAIQTFTSCARQCLEEKGV